MTEATPSSRLSEAFLARDTEAFGALFVELQNGSTIITGTLNSSLDVNEVLAELALTLFPGTMPMVNVANTRKKGIHVVVEAQDERTAASTVAAEEIILDEIATLYQGELPLTALTRSGTYKRENWQTMRKVEACVAVTGFIAPIVVDRHLQIIDGDLRYSVAEELYTTGRSRRSTVPVIVLDVEGVKADFLRLVLNRSAEFQRWKYDEVDSYIDAVPVALPLLEPLGFFGERVLPDSFFGATVLDYEIHEDFKSQQNFYKQEYGLAKWAEIQRERIMAEDAKKKAKKTKKPTEDMVGLFDLMGTFKEEDLLPVYNMEIERAAHVEAMKEVAGTITDNYDEKRRAEKEAKGQAWQTSRRAPKKVIADLKAEAAAKQDGSDGA